MDDWRLQQQRMAMSNIGPIHSYHSLRARPTPYSYPQPSPPPQAMTLNRPRPIPYSYPPVYYPTYPMKSKVEDCYYPPVPAQQLPPDYPSIYSSPSQIFPSPPSNPSTPYQGEFTDFGVPYQHGQPSSVNSITDALCPSGGEIVDRQTTPGPPSVGTPRVPPHQYSFPQTPSTPRLPTEQNIDELTAFLQDPMNLFLTEDLASTLLEDIEVLAHTYLGTRHDPAQNSPPADSDLDYDIILNYLCSDDLLSTK